MKEVAKYKVWSNGKTIRKYTGQDKLYASGKYGDYATHPSKGFKIMTCVLYEEDECPACGKRLGDEI